MTTSPPVGTSAMELRTWRGAYGSAEHATEAVKAALVRIGVRERFYRSLRPAVTAPGLPLVYVGYLPADVVEQIAAALNTQNPGPLTHADPVSADRQDG
ncbi:hypothetical protein [Streptomyces sp. NPDC054863]